MIWSAVTTFTGTTEEWVRVGVYLGVMVAASYCVYRGVNDRPLEGRARWLAAASFLALVLLVQ